MYTDRLLDTIAGALYAYIEHNLAPEHLRMMCYETDDCEKWVFDDSNSIAVLAEARERQLLAELEMITETESDIALAEWVHKVSVELDNNWSPLDNNQDYLPLDVAPSACC